MSKSIFLRHESGSTNIFGGRKLAKLLSELKAGRGMAEIVQLQMNGYTETLGGLDISSLTYEDLVREASGNFDHV
jgi:hypothetical protein